ncbi:MAG: DUF4097 family beta strand repeat protein [Elusimicrobiales bacterium]|jgi:DUF4097 and DUF4098 domain-containing protein YvlB|nr:DUF4097 family beta strand repeat protein [Elusimicrobiales bacterium]NLH38911.1 DUF4097 domain-containing protein [Elusimicrobiota bacterium]
MIKKLIEIVVLLILIIGLMFLVSNIGPVSPDARVVIKYIWFGLIGILGLAIVAITVISVVTIVFGISWLKNVVSFGGYKSGIGGFVKDAVNGSFDSGSSSFKDVKNFLQRDVKIEMDKYPYKSLTIKTNIGDIKVYGWDKEGISADVEVYEKEELDGKLCFENGELIVKSKGNNKAFIGEVTIYVPKSLSSINLSTVSGDVILSDIVTDENSFINTVNGDVRISNFKNSSEFSVKTVNGDLKIDSSEFNSILFNAVSGDVNFNSSKAENGSFKTVSGDMDLSNSDIKKSSVKTLNGKIIN